MSSNTEGIRHKANRSSQRSSVFMRARQSFVRSGGNRGATIENLRGTKGADFEGTAEIARVRAVACGCFGGSRSTSNIVLLIKGPFCFVFRNETAESPMYAINLAHLTAKVKSNRTVDLETSLGDVEYEVTFATSENAELFARVVTTQAAVGEADEVRKRLGHEHLLNKRSSLRYAESVASKKIEEAPDAPSSNDDVLAGVVATAGL